MAQIHTTIGVYKSKSYKVNGVPHDHLETHIEYNKTFRPGRALFVDGVCVYDGYLNENEVAEMTEQLKNIKVEKDTKPYH